MTSSRFVTTLGRVGLAAILLAASALACSMAAQPAASQSPTDVVATVGSETITLAQVDARALQQPAANFGSLRLSQAVYEARRAMLDEMVGDALIAREAAARKIDRDRLVDQEITSKVTAPDDREVTAWYQAHLDRVRGAPLEQIGPAIRAYLIQERTQTARQALVDRLRSTTAVTLRLEPPRVDVKPGDGPARGAAGASVQIVEFSDFQCPYCLAAHPTVKRVLDAYGDRIHFVYRNYPLPNHPNARPAAEAAQCANEQGQFWAYHDRLFADPSKLSVPDLKRTAAELGLDAARFNACVDSHKYKSVVDADMKAGEEAGVTGTPAFYINGRELSGAQPFETFKRVIDEELAAKR